MAQDETPDNQSLGRKEINEIINAAVREETAFSAKTAKADVGVWWKLLASSLAVLAVLFAGLYMHQVGVLDLSAVRQEADTEVLLRPLDTSSLLSILLPVFAVVGAFIVGITGLQRLQAYDEEFRKNRTERREDMNALQDRLAAQLAVGVESAKGEAEKIAESASESRIKDFFNTIEAELDRNRTERREDSRELETRLKETLADRQAAIRAELKASTETIAKDAAASKIHEKTSVLEDHVARLDLRIGDFHGQIEKRIERIRHILENPNIEMMLSDRRVASMGQLHQRLSELLRNDGDVRTAEVLVEVALANGITGTATDAFNAATTLAQADLEPLAYKIANAGLEQFPNNPDLLSNTLKFASDAGLADEAATLYLRVRDLPLDQRNWRIWVFIGDYLHDRGAPGEAEEWYLSYLHRYFDENWNPLEKPELPRDLFNERVAASYITLLNQYGRYDEGIRLMRAILKQYPRSSQTALQGAVTMRELGKFEEAAEYAHRSLLSDVLDQSNTGNASAYEVQATWALVQVSDLIAAGNSPAAAKASADLFQFCNAMLASPDARPNHLEWIRYNANKAAIALMRTGMTQDAVCEIVPERVRPLIAAVGSSRGADPTHEARNFSGLIEILWSEIESIATSNDDKQLKSIDGLVRALREGVANEALPGILAQLVAKAEAEGTDDKKDVVRQISERLQN